MKEVITFTVRKQMTDYGKRRYRFNHKRRDYSFKELANMEKFDLILGRSISLYDQEQILRRWNEQINSWRHTV